jgi:LysM repeat protein
MVDIQEVGSSSASASASAASTQHEPSRSNATRQTGNSDYYGGHNDTSATSVYYVKYGDTLTAIAYSLGVSLDHLIQSNPQIDPNLIYEGDAIYY